MPKPCTVCIHESRAAIETAILNRKPLRGIARDFGFTYVDGKSGEPVPDHSILARHRDRHMGRAYATAVAEAENQSGAAIVRRLEDLESNVDRVLTEAWKGKPVMVGDVPLLNEDGSPVMSYDLRLVLAAVKEGRGNAELLAKLAGHTDNDAADVDAVRRHLESPEARRLLAQLESLAAKEDAREQAQPRTD